MKHPLPMGKYVPRVTLNTPILQADISQRVAFAEAFAAGKTPDVRVEAPAAPHVAATLPAVRRRPGQGGQ